jgi:predicted DNA-binding protein (MmcQ/YjbR family)
MGNAKHIARAETELRHFALSFPEAFEDHPWGELAIKVKGKVFLFMSSGKSQDGTLSLSVKLPVSGTMALTLPFASPTHYGLGKSGWVSARFNGGDDVPVDMLKEWIDESFRAVAPKRVLAQLEDAEDDQAPPAAAKSKVRGRTRE